MNPTFLAYHHSAGVTRYAPLETANEPIFYLPAAVEDEIELDSARPAGRNDVAQIELISSLPFLSAYGKEICQLILDGQELGIPASTDNAIRSVLLRDGDQFQTSAGRWSIQRDDEQGTIQNSMRPPPLPELPVRDNLEPLDLPQKKPVFTIHSVPALPVQLGNSFVDNVPYSDQPPLQEQQATRSSTDGYGENAGEIEARLNSTQGSPREMLNNALDNMLDSSCDTAESGVKTTAGMYEVPTEPASHVVSESALATDDDEDRVDVADASPKVYPRRRKRPKSAKTEGPTKKRKGNIGDVRASEETSCRPQTEETLIVVATPNPLNRSPSPQAEMTPSVSAARSPSSSKRVQSRGRRSAEQMPPVSTPESRWTPDTTSHSPIGSSGRSTRSRRSESNGESSSGAYEGSPVVYFASNTTVDEKHKTMKSFYELGGKKAKGMGDANMLCVVDGQLKKSEAFLVAIAQGADIVTEDWVVEAHRKTRFPDPSKYLPKAKGHEQAWGFRLHDAVRRGKEGLTHLLDGTIVYLTAQFKKEMGKTCSQGIANVATALGADAVKPMPKNGRKVQNAFAIGVAVDAEACEVGRLGMRLYDKELLTSAVLNGHLDLDSNDYSIPIPVKEEDKE